MSSIVRALSRKVPAIDVEACNSCGVCVTVCAANAIQSENSMACAKCIKYCLTMNVPCDASTYTFDYQKCESCGACIDACPENAVYWFTTF